MSRGKLIMPAPLPNALVAASVAGMAGWQFRLWFCTTTCAAQSARSLFKSSGTSPDNVPDLHRVWRWWSGGLSVASSGKKERGGENEEVKEKEREGGKDDRNEGEEERRKRVKGWTEEDQGARRKERRKMKGRIRKTFVPHKRASECTSKKKFSLVGITRRRGRDAFLSARMSLNNRHVIHNLLINVARGWNSPRVPEADDVEDTFHSRMMTKATTTQKTVSREAGDVPVVHLESLTFEFVSWTYETTFLSTVFSFTYQPQVMSVFSFHVASVPASDPSSPSGDGTSFPTRSWHRHPSSSESLSRRRT